MLKLRPIRLISTVGTVILFRDGTEFQMWGSGRLDTPCTVPLRYTGPHRYYNVSEFIIHPKTFVTYAVCLYQTNVSVPHIPYPFAGWAIPSPHYEQV